MDENDISNDAYLVLVQFYFKERDPSVNIHPAGMSELEFENALEELLAAGFIEEMKQ